MFQCPECDKQFDKKRGLDMHVKRTHSKAPETKTTKTKTTATPLPSEMTPDQRAIHERAAKQDIGWMTIREDELNDFSLMKNPFDLPPEAQKLQDEKKYAFRFCERTPDRIDYLTRSVEPPLKWAIVTRTSLPVLSKYIDDLWGCICVRDQVLLFKPWHHHVLVKKAKEDLAEVGYQSGSLTGRKQQIESKTEGVEAYAEQATPEKSKYKIGGSDVVMADEAEVDKTLGIQDDTTELGDLVVEE